MQGILAQEICGNGSAEETTAPRQRQRVAVVRREPELLETREPGGVERLLEAGDRERVVEAKAEHHALSRARVAVDLLDLAVVRAREIARDLRRVAPTLALDRRHRADARPR